MELVFFDEAKNDAEYPHYHIGAVCIDEANLATVEEKLSAVAQDVFGVSAPSMDTEFHAAEIYHRKRNFKNWSDFEKRVSVIERVIEVLSLEEVQRIDIQINCALLRGEQRAEDIAFMFLCERANDLLKSHKSLGMLIGDRENDRHAERFSATLSGYKVKGTDFAYGRDIKHLVDSVHFTHSHLSRFLQLADTYAWLLQFRNRNLKSENPRHKAIFKILARDDINLYPSKYKEWPKE